MNRERNRLLTINILARLDRVNRLQGMPVVGRNDYHRINVGPGQQFSIIIIGRAAFICPAGSLGGVGLLNVIFTHLTSQTAST